MELARNSSIDSSLAGKIRRHLNFSSKGKEIITPEGVAQRKRKLTRTFTLTCES